MGPRSRCHGPSRQSVLRTALTDFATGSAMTSAHKNEKTPVIGRLTTGLVTSASQGEPACLRAHPLPLDPCTTAVRGRTWMAGTGRAPTSTLSPGMHSSCHSDDRCASARGPCLLLLLPPTSKPWNAKLQVRQQMRARHVSRPPPALDVHARRVPDLPPAPSTAVPPGCVLARRNRIVPGARGAVKGSAARRPPFPLWASRGSTLLSEERVPPAAEPDDGAQRVMRPMT